MDLKAKIDLAIASKVRMIDVEMVAVNLADENLSTLQADRLNLARANLNGAKLIGARMGNCSFHEAKLEKADLANAILRNCQLSAVQGGNACFNYARLEDSSVKGATMNEASFISTHLTETSFERSVLERCNFRSAQGEGVGFRGADLRNATLIEANFSDADFRGADLRGADLSKGCFSYSDFRGALLEGANFANSDCKGALFDKDAGPNASQSQDEEKAGNSTFTSMLMDQLGANLADLSEESSDNKNYIKDMADRMQQAGKTFKATAKHSPDDWKAWAESFVDRLNTGQSIDLDTLVDILHSGPINLPNHLGLENFGKEDMVKQFKTISNILNSETTEPPEEWKPFFEPLMQTNQSKEKVDFRFAMELFADLLKNNTSSK